MKKFTFYRCSKFHLDLHTTIYKSRKTLRSKENEKEAIYDRHQFSERKAARKRDGSFDTQTFKFVPLYSGDWPTAR